MAVIAPRSLNVRAHCVADLMGRAPGSFVRPNYRFLVTVWGEPPHNVTRKYEIVAYGEETAAGLALDRFKREMTFCHPDLAEIMLGKPLQ